MSSVEELLEEGERFIEKGLPIIPCNDKKPCDYRGVPCDNWHNLPVTVERLRIGLKAASNPGIGLIMGRKSKIIDMEVDDDDERDAMNDLWRGVDRPISPAFQSKRGRHDLFAFDDRLLPIGMGVFEWKTTDGKKFKIRLGIGDVAAQSIIPPSEPRSWLPGLSLDDVDPAPLPATIIDRLIAQAATKKKKSPRGGSVGGVHPTALEAIRKSTAKMEDGGDGSKRLFTAACRSVELNLNDAEVIATIRAYAAEKPFPRDWSDDEIVARVRDAENTVERGSEVVISNFAEVEIATPGLLSDGSAGEGETKIVTVPKSMGEIVDDIMRHSGGWPRRIDNMLFVDDSKHGLAYFDRRTTAAAFGWLRRHFKVQWSKGGNYATQGEVFAELERTAKRYDAVEVMAHEPPVAGLYYRGNTPAPGDGSHLAWLLKRFRPATTVDGDLIKAAFMTPMWGGAPGRRPAFVFTSDDGRGAGKTTVCEMIGRLYNGLIDVSAGEDIQQLKTRMLSPAARSLRIGLVDNIKTLRFSWAEFEAIITSPVISGRQLFVGEAQRPNLVTWLLSLNGPAMATDMAQRSVIIKVVKGENPGDWHEKTTAFIDEHRDELLGDLIAALRAEKNPLANYSRWATWESEVLCRLPDPGEAQQLILERQGEVNCELEEGEIIEQYFAEQLTSFGYEPNSAQVRIPTTSAAYWFTKAVGEPMKSSAASRRLHQMAKEGQLKRISEDSTRTYGRGFVWTGPAADVFGGTIDNNLASLIAERLSRPF